MDKRQYFILMGALWVIIAIACGYMDSANKIAFYINILISQLWIIGSYFVKDNE